MSNLQILDLPLQPPNLQELTELELKQVVGGNSLAPNRPFRWLPPQWQPDPETEAWAEMMNNHQH
jgi:bacteriocin-like protein